MKIKMNQQQRETEKRLNQLLAENMELTYQYQKLMDETAWEKQQREEVLRVHEAARRLKHDMKNHIMVINAYLLEDETEKARQYLSQVMDELNHIYTYIETGNSLLNHVLNQKLEYAHRMGIHIKAQIENLTFAVMESVDFVSLLSNLLDNAVEGAGSRTGAPILSVVVVAKRGYETIQVKNSILHPVLPENPKLCSSKKEKSHGYGVRQIRDIVEKYKGLCRFYEEDEMFCVEVMIPAKSANVSGGAAKEDSKKR